jgi:hypothetical protein
MEYHGMIVLFSLCILLFSEVWDVSARKSGNGRKLNEEMESQLFNKTDFFQTKRCRNLRKTHKVRPGVSWGSMNRELQDLWIKMKCDQFFCKPHQLAGKGIYNCVPLEPTEPVEV